MSRGDVLEFRLSKEQKDIIKDRMGKNASTLVVDVSKVSLPLYGVVLPKERSAKTIINLTPEQKKIVKRKLKTDCDFIEVTRKMTFR